MESRKLEAGDVVQIDPETDEVFGGCLMMVTDPKVWGAQGAVQIPGKGLAYYRCRFASMEFVGKATWRLDNKGGD